MIENVLEIKDTHVREVMTPLVDLVAIDSGASLLDFHKLLATHQYSRCVRGIIFYTVHYGYKYITLMIILTKILLQLFNNSDEAINFSSRLKLHELRSRLVCFYLRTNKVPSLNANSHL